MANAIAKLALTKKAQEVVIMDLRPLTSMTDFFVVCSADSDIQVKAIADAVLGGTEEKGIGPWHKETKSHNWMLLDFSDVVLHIFHRTARSFYNLEKLWGDAKMKYIRDEKPAGKQPKPVSPKSAKPKKKSIVRSTKGKPARKKTAK
ncbi:MAG: ribosome silencing factor [Bacteroidetes bacterium]|nr:ribosome silencing factor [Bacteroidota bacterium]MCW5894214.1 ribosome silencing factor [Bacteroidota bacterium]